MSWAIRLIDADGRDVIPSLRGSVDVPPPAEPGIPGRVRIAVAFSHIKFEAYGIYSFYITIQGDGKVCVPLRVARPKARQDSRFTPIRSRWTVLRNRGAGQNVNNLLPAGPEDPVAG